MKTYKSFNEEITKCKNVKFENKSIDGEPMNEAFNFKGAVEQDFLSKSDEKYVTDLKKKGWSIDDFILTSKGFEIVIKKGSKEMKFTDKRPELVLKKAAQKAK